MTPDHFFKRISIIGVGLLGASIGLALKDRGFKGRISGVGRDKNKLLKARAAGIIDTYSTSMEGEASDADLIIICTPVSTIPGIYKKIYPHLSKKAIVTDVGSTKHKLIKDISLVEKNGSHFIGSHPMAGSEKSGAEAGSADMFKKAVVAVINNKDTSKENLRKINSFWEHIGGKVVNLSSKDHDEIVSITSHVPHIISYLVAYSCMKSRRSANLFNKIYGNGLLDVTRLSLSDIDMWTDIFSANRKNILSDIKKYKKNFAFFEKLLLNEDYGKLKKVLRDIKEFSKNISANRRIKK